MRTRWFALPFCLAALLGGTPAVAERVELPIKMTIGKGGVARFSTTITINGQAVEAGFDTGSTGLRVLAPALPDGADLKGQNARIGFNAGAVFDGPVVRAKVGFGTLAPRETRLQRIDRITCDERMPGCATADLDVSRFGIMGDNVPGQGYRAIFGIGLRQDAVPNPLVEHGAERWIVELPRTPAETGRLIVDPTAAETAGYKSFKMLSGTNLVSGCITSATTKLCAPAMVDTGAPGIQIFGGRPENVLPQGTEAALTIGDGSEMATMRITIGRRDQGAMMRVRPARPGNALELSFGLAPYLRWLILYDFKERTIGVAERPPSG